MKKRLISFIAIFSMFSGVAYAYNADGYANEKREIEGAQASLPYREYQLVRFAENNLVGVSLSAGDVVVRDCVSDDGVTVGLIAVGSSDSVVGVVVSPLIRTCDVTGSTAITDYGRRNWGYIQVRGYCATVNITSGPSVAGASLIASGTSRYATGETNGGAADSSKSKVLGFAYDASSQGQSEAEISL